MPLWARLAAAFLVLGAGLGIVLLSVWRDVATPPEAWGLVVAGGGYLTGVHIRIPRNGETA